MKLAAECKGQKVDTICVFLYGLILASLNFNGFCTNKYKYVNNSFAQFGVVCICFEIGQFLTLRSPPHIELILFANDFLIAAVGTIFCTNLTTMMPVILLFHKLRVVHWK